MQPDQQSGTLSTNPISLSDRRLALSIINSLETSLEILRKKYKTAGHYERQHIVEQARQIKEQIKKKQTQYKIIAKKHLDEWEQGVVDALF